MKSLLTLLFLISFHIHCGFIDNKGLDCNVEIKNAKEIKYIGKKERKIIWFNNSKVDIARTEGITTYPVNKELDYLNYEEARYIDTRKQVYNYLNHEELKYLDARDTIYWQKKFKKNNTLFVRKYIIDRNGRIIVTEHLVLDKSKSYKILMEGKCTIFSSFDYVKKYQIKAREGN